MNVLAIAWLALGLVWAIGFGSWAAWVAGERNRRRPPWFLFGAILGPGALAILNAAPPGVCARCLSPVVGWSTTCAFCGEDVRANPMVEVMLGSEQPQPRPARAPMAATSPAAVAAPVQFPAPAVVPTPVAAEATATAEAPVAVRAPVAVPALVADQAPVAVPAPVADEAPVANEVPPSEAPRRTRRRKPAARTAAGTARPPSEPAPAAEPVTAEQARVKPRPAIEPPAERQPTSLVPPAAQPASARRTPPAPPIADAGAVANAATNPAPGRPGGEPQLDLDVRRPMRLASCVFVEGTEALVPGMWYQLVSEGGALSISGPQGSHARWVGHLAAAHRGPGQDER